MDKQVQIETYTGPVAQAQLNPTVKSDKLGIYNSEGFTMPMKIRHSHSTALTLRGCRDFSQLQAINTKSLTHVEHWNYPGLSPNNPMIYQHI